MDELILKTKCYLTTQVGTQVVRESTQAEWENYGEILRRIDEAKQWAIGDWLVDGKRHYGDGLYKQAAGITGLEARYLENLKQIADRFEITHRCVELSWAHHREVASVKEIHEDIEGKLFLSDEADQKKIAEFLADAEKHSWSLFELRAQVRAHKEWQRAHIAAANEPDEFRIEGPGEYVTRDGRKATVKFRLPYSNSRCWVGWITGEAIYSWYENGRYWGCEERSPDIVGPWGDIVARLNSSLTDSE